MGIIGNIRKHSWIAVLIVGVAIVAFIIGDLTKNRQGYPDMGKINGTTITYQRLNQLIEEAENNYKRQQGVSQVPNEVEYQLREQVWQTLVGETLTDEQFDKLGLTVTTAELSDMYLGDFVHPYLRQAFTDPSSGQYQTQAIQYYIDNFDNLDTLQRLEWLNLEKAVKTDRQQQKYSTLLASGLYMPKALAAKVSGLSAQLANATAVKLAYQDVADDEVTLTDDDFKKYYEKHKAEYRVSEELRELNYIVYPIVPTQKDMADIQASVEKTWEEFQTTDADELIFFVNSESDMSYDSNYMNASQFAAPMDSAIMAAGEGSFISPRIVGNQWMMAKVLKVANRPDSLRASTIYILNSKAGGEITRDDAQAKHLADSVLALVKGGAMSFEEAVSQFSDDPQKANNGGDMEWQLDGNYGFLNEEMVNTPEGGVFICQHPNEVGYFVVKVTGKTPMHRKYRVATITRAIVASNSTTEKIYNEASKFASNNRTVAEMTAAAQAENLQVRNAMTNSMSYNIAGIKNARSIVQWAYNEKTEKDEVANQIFEAEDMYIVAALKDVYKKGYATLDQVRTMMENQVRIEKKAELLKARLAEAAQGSNDLRAIAQKMNATVDTLDSIAFNGYYLGQYGMEPQVQSAITASEQGALVGPIQGASGVYMVQVNAKVDNPNPASEEATRNQLQQTYMQKLRMNAFQQALMEKATITDERYKVF